MRPQSSAKMIFVALRHLSWKNVRCCVIEILPTPSSCGEGALEPPHHHHTHTALVVSPSRILSSCQVSSGTSHTADLVPPPERAHMQGRVGTSGLKRSLLGMPTSDLELTSWGHEGELKQQV